MSINCINRLCSKYQTALTTFQKTCKKINQTQNCGNRWNGGTDQAVCINRTVPFPFKKLVKEIVATELCT